MQALAAVASLLLGADPVSVDATACKALPAAPAGWPARAKILRRACDDPAQSELCATLACSLRDGAYGFVDNDRSFAYSRCACSRNKRDGCNELGAAYERGAGVPRDYARAGQIYQLACDAGSAVACGNLGNLHELGQGIEQSDTRAVALYERGCKSDEASSCARLAYMLDRGRGTKRDIPRAARLYEAACDQGVEAACNNLGVFHHNGVDRARDVQKARKLYEKACTPQYPPGCLELGKLYLYGTGVPQDPKQAAAIFKRGCDAFVDYERDEVCAMYAWMVVDGRDDKITKEKAGEILERACKANIGDGCVGLGQYFAKLRDGERALSAFRRACELGRKQGCKAVKVFEDGQVVRKP